MVFVACYLNKRGNTEIICSIFANPQNKMILEMPVYNFKENIKKMCVEASPLKK